MSEDQEGKTAAAKTDALSVNFGDLRRLTPVARQFGFDRGKPVDRYYIEKFISTNAVAIRGRVLEFGDSCYTTQFGREAVSQSDVLSVDSSNHSATIVADLSDAQHVPSASFDCIICTQTLQLIYDVGAAVGTLERILKPGGRLLVTVPGISQIDDATWSSSWFWSFTPASVRRLIGDVFGADNVEVAGHGNVLASTAFLYGLPQTELDVDELEYCDPGYPLVITAAATKRPKGRSAQETRIDSVCSISNVPRLAGAHIDVPRQGEYHHLATVPMGGWVIGRQSPAGRVEAVAEGRVLGTFPVGLPRDDVARAFPQLECAAQSGFAGTVSVAVRPGVVVCLSAVLQDGSSAELGQIHLSDRSWPDQAAHPSEGVSIVIPCYNQARFLAEAIESALAQTYPNIEIVVVDDGSTDNTAAVTTRYERVHYIHQRNQGLPAARNTGLRHSLGRMLVFLDADDRLLPGAVSEGVRHLLEHEDSALASGEHRYIKDDGTILQEWKRVMPGSNHFEALLRGNYIGMIAAVIFRRSAIESVGAFDTSLNACEDYDLYLRIAAQFPISAHDRVVAEYRRHDGAMSNDPARMLHAAVTVLKRQSKALGDRPELLAAWRCGLREWRSVPRAPSGRARVPGLALAWETASGVARGSPVG